MKGKKRKRRPPVDRAERVKPTPEAAAKLKPWPLMLLLVEGPEAGGLDADEFEACIEIVEAFRAATRHLGFSANSIDNRVFAGQYEPPMSERDARLAAYWFAWSADVGPVATLLVEQIEDTVPIRSPDVLRSSARRWLKLKIDMHRTLDKPREDVLTMSARWFSATGDRGALPISTPPSPPSQGPSRAGAPAQAAVRSITSRR